MRYLLCGINAKYIHSNLAVFCLKAYAEANVPGAGKNVWNGRETDETGDGKAEAAAGPEFVIKEYTINHYVENILQDLYEEKADVIVDFSSAKAVDALLSFCEKTGTACVLCTTGLSEEQLARVKAVSEKAAVLRSANMSLGIYGGQMYGTDP